MLENNPFKRTECFCPACRKCCKQGPGYTIPGDIKRISEYVRLPINLVLTFFTQGKGADVFWGNGNHLHVNTIVPRTDTDGKCIFLLGNERCSIHPVAPFGCAFFDMHMPREQGDERSLWGLKQILMDHKYSYRWRKMGERKDREISAAIQDVRRAGTRKAGTDQQESAGESST